MMQRQSINQTLRAARSLLEYERHLTKNVLARNAQGHSVDPKDPKACCWCALGALERVASNADAYYAAAAVLKDTLCGEEIWAFSDRSPHIDVLIAFDIAIERQGVWLNA